MSVLNNCDVFVKFSVTLYVKIRFKNDKILTNYFIIGWMRFEMHFSGNSLGYNGNIIL